MNPTLRRGLLAVDVALLALAVVALTTLRVADELSLTERPDVEACLAAAVNAARLVAGVEPVKINGMTVGARAWASEMADSDTLKHSNLRQQYPGSWSEGGLGENVATDVGTGTCTAMAERLAASPEHQMNTLDPKWRVLGVGAVESEGVLWAVVAFGEPAATGPESAPPSPTGGSPTVTTTTTGLLPGCTCAT